MMHDGVLRALLMGSSEEAAALSSSYFFVSTLVDILSHDNLETAQ